MLATIKQYKKHYVFTNHTAVEQILLYPGPTNRAGWYLQQALKLYSGKVLKLTDYVVLDSDIIWHRQIRFKVSPDEAIAKRTYLYSKELEEIEGKPIQPSDIQGSVRKVVGSQQIANIPMYNYAYSTQYLRQYYATMKPLLGFEPKAKYHYSGIVHHMVIVKEVIEDFTAYLEDRHGIEMWKALMNVSALELSSRYPMKHLPGAGHVLSEFELYFHFAKKYWRQTVNQKQLLWANGPAIYYQYWPKTTDNSIPADSWRRSSHWKFDRNPANTFPKQCEADALEGYDFVAYHSYASRRYFEIMNSDVDDSPACTNLPMLHTPQEYYHNTTCSWKNFNEEIHDKSKWFENCLCYMFRYRTP